MPSLNQPNQSKMRRLCREAIRKLAKDHDLKVIREGKELRIVGPLGDISDHPHGETFNEGFEPGLLNDGVVLGWTHTDQCATGDNFRPSDPKQVDEVLRMIGVKS